MKFSYLGSQNAEYIEEQLQRYLADPDSVDPSWRFFFEGIELGIETQTDGQGPQAVSAVADSASIKAELNVARLIEAYRRYGCQAADLNPIEPATGESPDLAIELYGFSAADLERKFQAGMLIGFAQPASLKDIITKLKAAYCGKIGYEFGHVANHEIRKWFLEQVELGHLSPNLNREQKARVLTKLTEAECFERFLHTRYVAKKRFSVEGGDALIPMLDIMVRELSSEGTEELVIGMAHRGRLNVLTNIFGKNYEYVFAEFDGKTAVDREFGSGDVKYHMGYSADVATEAGRKVHLSLASNPSHLEFVNPVVQGMAKAKQQKYGERAFTAVVPMQIHGDAAFAGQGVCYETIQLSQVRGYNTGGTIHIIVNNQVGFTTNPVDSRSTTWSSDMIKMLDCPVFHVNGDDAEAVAFVSKLVAKYRQKFQRDVLVDIVCYRKYGHNEGDEPQFTQPLMYKALKDHPSPREIYSAKLQAEGSIPESESVAFVEAANAKLQASYEIAKSGDVGKGHAVSVFAGAWKGLKRASAKDIFAPANTAVGASVLKEIGKKIGSVPTGFTPHPKLVRLLEARAQMVEKGEGIDWGMGELLAYGSLLWEGTDVRMTGQDCERGTFTHRHAVLVDFNTGEKFAAIKNLKDSQGRLAIFNSTLSETAVMGFEYGYASSDPKALVIWEAQFGDFANGAQVIIDQFIASSETKWQRMNGLVLLLPHGYEGQGPEHSSARLERFLQMGAENNMSICNLTTPAQIFHALRRQVHRDFRKPLVIMSPKSLLRHPMAVSKLDELSQGSFQEIIDDPGKPLRADRVVFCSGKIYYELVKERAEKKREQNVAIVRVEQLYPFNEARVAEILKQYSSAKEIVWTQEEPRNMGGWFFIRDRIESLLGGRTIKFAGRPDAAAPACGSDKLHEKEQHKIHEEAIQ